MGRNDDDFSLSLDSLDSDVEFILDDDVDLDLDEKEIEDPKDTGKDSKGNPLVVDEDESFEIDEDNPDDGLNVDDDEDDDTGKGTPSKTKDTKKPTTPSDVDKPGDASSPPSQLYAAFAKKLAEDGVLSEFDEDAFTELVEEFGNPSEALVESVRKSVIEAIDEYKKNADEDYRVFLEARDNNVPVDEYTGTAKLISELEKLDDDIFEEDETKAEFVIRESLIAKGFKPAKIEKLLKQYEALGTTAEEAIEAKDELLENKKAELAELKQQAEHNKKEAEKRIKIQQESLKQFIDNTEEIIPGVTVSKKEKDTIYKSIVEPAGYYPNGQPFNKVMETRSKNPVAFERMLHYLHNIGIFNLDDKSNPKPDWSKITKVKQTKVADDFDKVISRSSGSFSSGKAARTRGSGDGDLDLGIKV